MTARARDLMAAPCASLHHRENTVAAARRLRAGAADTLPVHGDDGEFVGMITTRAIIDNCVAGALDPASTPAGSLIGTPGPFAHPDEPAGADLLEVMLRHDLVVIPVVENCCLVGLLSLDAVAAELVPEDDAHDDLAEIFWQLAMVEPVPRPTSGRRTRRRDRTRPASTRPFVRRPHIA